MPGHAGRGGSRRSLDGGGRKRTDGLVIEGTVVEALPNAMFAVELEGGERITSHIPGADRARLIRVVPGDRVTVEISPNDLSRGRITARHRL